MAMLQVGERVLQMLRGNDQAIAYSERSVKRDVECNRKKCLTDGWLSGGRVKRVGFRDEST